MKLTTVYNKLINEELINEDYDEVQEIGNLSYEILKELVLLNLERFVKWAKQSYELDASFYFYPVVLNDVYLKANNKFPKLKEFLENSKNTEIEVIIKDGDNKGNYTRIKREKYNNDEYKSIDFSIPIVDLVNMKAPIKNLGDGSRIEYAQELFKQLYKFKTILDHEVQHNYDDYRSDTKAFQSKEAEDFNIKGVRANKLEGLYKKAYLNSLERHQQYLNLPHEIWARFTQFILKYKFTNTIKLTNDEGGEYLGFEMKPLKRVVDEFDFEFVGVELLTPKMRKRLIKQVVQFWHKDQERIKILNLKSETTK